MSNSCHAHDWVMAHMCRSRLYTTASITWLLYAFYSLLTEYFVNVNSGSSPPSPPPSTPTHIRIPMRVHAHTFAIRFYYSRRSFLLLEKILLTTREDPFYYSRRSFLITQRGLFSRIPICLLKGVNKMSLERRQE